MNTTQFFATTPKGCAPLLADELAALGAQKITPGTAGVEFHASLVTAYRACLWSRTANRILLPLTRFSAPDPDSLYSGVQAVAWEEHLSPDHTLAVDFSASASAINHTRFAAQKVKDAIVDRLREHHGRRPTVDRRQPDLRINGYLLNDTATISLDLSGDSLHRRGYRQEPVPAPLKENLAAALLLKAGWPALAAEGAPLLDPMCGSGTLLIEAAWLAGDSAPGLLRSRWGFQGWLQHDPTIWHELLAEAEQRRRDGIDNIPALTGYDQDARAIRAALRNIGQAGLQNRIHLERRSLADIAPVSAKNGLLIANPPYGERLGERDELAPLYARLGDILKACFPHWQAAVFTGNPELGKRMGLRAQRINAFYNGAIACKLLRFAVEPEWFVDREAADSRARDRHLQKALDGGAGDFVNRLRKNQRTLGRWAEREGIGCYRVYDADIPEYAVAIDRYESWLQVQEYAPPRTIEPARAQERLDQVMAVLPEVLGVRPEHIQLKVRRRQQRPDQYQKSAARGHHLEIREGPARFLVNLTDYLDTGLFLDHRPTRKLIGELARGRRFLNLFAYTGSATVYAALGGASSTTSVDMSQTYLDWAQRNLQLNGIDESRHVLIKADCLVWLKRAQGDYDLIFLDPPTFSNSKRMPTDLDVQRDHPALIHSALTLLAAGGTLIFSTHQQRFTLDQTALADLSIEDISRQTIPRDFQRNSKIHRCWKIGRTP